MTYSEKQMYEIHKDINNINTVKDRKIFYVNNIVAICNRENVPKFQVFKEELMKKFKIV